MYCIINKTRKENYTIEGDWPDYFIDKMLDEGNKLIVVSSYSNTIKVPFKDEYGNWEFTEFEYNSENIQFLPF